jgi:hypothetical protein
MIKREANFGQTFRSWMRANPSAFLSASFELKQTGGKSLPFSAVQEHQLDALCASASGLLYKIPDDSRGVKPFDMVYLNNAPGYVVIKYPDSFHIIPVHRFIAEKALSSRKSLTEDRARQIAHTSVDL